MSFVAIHLSSVLTLVNAEKDQKGKNRTRQACTSAFRQTWSAFHGETTFTFCKTTFPWNALCQTALRQTALCQTALCQTALCQTALRQTAFCKDPFCETIFLRETTEQETRGTYPSCCQKATTARILLWRGIRGRVERGRRRTSSSSACQKKGQDGKLVEEEVDYSLSCIAVSIVHSSLEFQSAQVHGSLIWGQPLMSNCTFGTVHLASLPLIDGIQLAIILQHKSWKLFPYELDRGATPIYTETILLRIPSRFPGATCLRY